MRLAIREALRKRSGSTLQRAEPPTTTPPFSRTATSGLGRRPPAPFFPSRTSATLSQAPPPLSTTACRSRHSMRQALQLSQTQSSQTPPRQIYSPRPHQVRTSFHNSRHSAHSRSRATPRTQERSRRPVSPHSPMASSPTPLQPSPADSLAQMGELQRRTSPLAESATSALQPPQPLTPTPQTSGHSM